MTTDVSISVLLFFINNMCSFVVVRAPYNPRLPCELQSDGIYTRHLHGNFSAALHVDNEL